MKKIIIAIVALTTVVSCQDITELNRDIKNPEQVPGTALFTNATVELFDFMVSTNVNVNNLRLWAQHWTETTYTDEANYRLTERDVNGYTWDLLYSTVWRDLQEAKMIIEEDNQLSEQDKANQIAIINTLEVFVGHLLVDFFGDVPYSEALGDDVTPVYDNDADIYLSLIDKLDNAIQNMEGQSSLGTADLIYNGNVTMWKKFAKSLKLRLAIRVADVSGQYQNIDAQQMAEEAFSDGLSGLISSPEEAASIQYTRTTPNTNPLWVDLVQSGRTDFVASETLVGYMNDLEDPRRDYYFTGPTDSAGNPIGGDFGATNTYTQFSHPGTRLLDPTLPGIIFDYVEVEFLLADAAERWGSTFGVAEEHYNNAIRTSIQNWGGSEQDATDYLSRPDVAYSSAAGTWREKIGLQKWIAMYNRGFEAWSTYRVYDAPEMELAAEVQMPPPLRYDYPVTEYSLNGANVEEAAAEYNDNDKWEPVFWDSE